MLSGFLDVAKGWTAYIVNDDDYYNAVRNCYSALCNNKEDSGWLGCSIDIEDVARVLVGYISYFVSHPEPEKSKYYYDEYSDRSDPYRKELVSIIAKSVSKDDKFVNDVLSYMYWGQKRGKVAKGLLQPLQQEKFKEDDWYLKGIWKGVFAITRAIYDGIIKVFKSVGYLIKTTLTVAEQLLNATGELMSGVGTTISVLPYIICGGVVAIVGFEAYKIKTTGKIFTPKDLVK